MSNPWGQAEVRVMDPRRGPVGQPVVKFFPQALSLTWSWGVSPAEAKVLYVSDASNPPLPNVLGGSWTEIELYGKIFYGLLMSPVYSATSRGNAWTLDFVDTREYLECDIVFGVFNREEVIMVAGVRTKRYWHVLPRDWAQGIRTYTSGPMTAQEILEWIFKAPTMGADWVRVYHPDQRDFPVYELDFMGGRKLSAVLAEIGEAQGLVMTLLGGPFTLVWNRLGTGPAATVPNASDDQTIGNAVARNATRIFVVGSRNWYQVLDLALDPDWNPAWEQFWYLGEFTQDIFERCIIPGSKDSGNPDGTRLNNIHEDLEQQQGRMWAASLAKTMTVAEYAALRPDVDFRDRRKFAGRSRMNMPAALYCSAVVYRAFRPPATIGLGNGRSVPLQSLRIVDSMVANVTHDPKTGIMEAILEDVAEGNGYAVINGYNVGSDLFASIKPERFVIKDWLSGKGVWAAQSFHTDEDGEGSQFVVFEEPVIVSADYVLWIDGWAVVNAKAKKTTPLVRASLTFEAELYQYTAGEFSRDEVANVEGLRKELVVQGTAVREVLYADGKSADAKAAEVAAVLLNRPAFVLKGSHVRKLSPGDTLTELSGMVQRVTLDYSSEGHIQTVEYAAERGRTVFEPERDLDRRARNFGLFAGQMELRKEAEALRRWGAGLKQDPKLAREAAKDFKDQIADQAMDNSGLPAQLPAGTPLWRKPVVNTPVADGNPINANTQAVKPAAVAEEHNIFVGVTLHHNEDAGSTVKTQDKGITLARVMGPALARDAIGRVIGKDYLAVVTGTDQPSVGEVLQDILDANPHLVQVRLGGGGGGGSGEALWA